VKSGPREMDAAYASVMREEGVSYRDIGIEIARREGRRMPYKADTVRRVILAFNAKLDSEKQIAIWISTIGQDILDKKSDKRPKGPQ
jgi:hypothetical protein